MPSLFGQVTLSSSLEKARAASGMSDVPVLLLTLVAMGETFLPADTLIKYWPLVSAVALALCVWAIVAKRKENERQDRVSAKIIANQHEHKAKLDALADAMEKDAQNEPPGAIQNAFKLSSEIARFASDIRPFDPASTLGLEAAMPPTTSPDMHRAYEMLRIKDNLDAERYSKYVAAWYKKRFKPEVERVGGEMMTAGLPHVVVAPVFREPKNLYDVEVLAEQLYGLAKTRRDCSPVNGKWPS
jgi:Ca2+/Na+ antiporter